MNRRTISSHATTLSSINTLKTSLNSLAQESINCDDSERCIFYVPNINHLLKQVIKSSRKFIHTDEATTLRVLNIINTYLKPVSILLQKIIQTLETRPSNFHTIHELLNTKDFYNNTSNVIHEITHIFTQRILDSIHFCT
uniref:Uncharacterized protein n=1 Tax=Pyramimonas orientalis virus TaxID=455367 RepID=A0A7M3UP88_POV01|nr:hypothetical protein HWQ62_00430 [Pyramimonas orientalis virus]